ncbi:MAG: 5'-deoxynucleotidase [Defluviitaleaceae bacterium]|nr:5'-deoxynucleotidase [Defluviitaleaceae bacterium]
MRNFLAMLFRMRYINRWGLMYNTYTESLSVHTLEAAWLVHFLCNIGNIYYGKNYDTHKLVTYALYHDSTEIVTGDLPTPIKYYNNDIKTAYKEIEQAAAHKLLSLLPEELQREYEKPIKQELLEEEQQIIKIADKLCAYIKCKKELNAGNKEFSSALTSTEEVLKQYNSPELTHFMEHYINTFEMVIDEFR